MNRAMQNYQSIDNSSPSASIGGDELGRIVGGPARKRIADDGAATRLRRKTAKTGHWKCGTCTADNPDALSHRCTACGTLNNKPLEKRDSITSHDGSSISLTIDELVSNLEGLEFDLDVDTYKPYGMNDSSLNDSTTSRFEAGHWSVRDLEKWSCSMCTYENEPLFCACEMCGQAKEVKDLPTKEAPLPSSTEILDNSSRNLDADSIRVQQEQRLTELIKFRLPPAMANKHNNSSNTTSVPLPPLSAAPTAITTSKPPLSPKPPQRKSGGKGRRSYSPLPPPRHSAIQEGKELDVFDVQKPRRSYNPEDSAATETTFDMSASANTFDMSASWFSDPIAYPGIEEETTTRATASR